MALRLSLALPTLQTTLVSKLDWETLSHLAHNSKSQSFSFQLSESKFNCKWKLYKRSKWRVLFSITNHIGLPSVQVWSVQYMHFGVKGFEIITLHSNFQTFLQHFTQKKPWYGPFCIKYENNLISHYIEEVHAIKVCTKSIKIPYIMHLIIIQLWSQSPPIFGQISSVKNSSLIIFSIGRLHNDTRINASNVSSFNRLLRSLFTQLCLENPCSHIVVLAKPKFQSVAKLKLQELLEFISVC